MKALKVFIKRFDAPQKSVSIKILECNSLITLTSTDRETNSKGKIVYQR